MADNTCPVCGGSEWRQVRKTRDRLHGLPGEFELKACEGCGLMRTLPSLDPERLSAYYPDDYYAYDAAAAAAPAVTNKRAYYLRHPLKALNALFYSKLLGQNRDVPVRAGQAVLDVGCGDGAYLRFKAAQGCRVFGVDINRRALERLKQTMPEATTFCGPLWNAGFDAESFDHIALSHVLEHIDEPVRLVAELRRLLKRNGTVRVQVPNARSLTSAIFRRFWIGLDTPRHVWVFSPRNLERLFEANGFRIISFRTPENSFDVLASLIFVYNALTGGRIVATRAKRYWDNELIKLLLLPYALTVNALRVGDVMELIAERSEKGRP